MAIPNYKVFRNPYPFVRPNTNLKHSAKGSEWEDHKYVKKIDGIYYYPVGYEDGRTVESLDKTNEKDDENIKNNKLDMVRNHFDQYLAKRGIDWRSLPKDEIDQMQKDIIDRIEKRKDFDVPEKTIDELAKDVISGKFGNGEDRKKLLGSGYLEVQKKVNELLKSSAGTKEISEATEETIKKVENIVKATKDSKIHSGVDMEKVQSVYRNREKE